MREWFGAMEIAKMIKERMKDSEVGWVVYPTPDVKCVSISDAQDKLWELGLSEAVINRMVRESRTVVVTTDGKSAVFLWCADCRQLDLEVRDGFLRPGAIPD